MRGKKFDEIVKSLVLPKWHFAKYIMFVAIFFSQINNENVLKKMVENFQTVGNTFFFVLDWVLVKFRIIKKWMPISRFDCMKIKYSKIAKIALKNETSVMRIIPFPVYVVTSQVVIILSNDMRKCVMTS